MARSSNKSDGSENRQPDSIITDTSSTQPIQHDIGGYEQSNTELENGINQPDKAANSTDSNTDNSSSNTNDNGGGNTATPKRGRPPGSTNKEKVSFGVSEGKTKTVKRSGKEPERLLYTAEEAKELTNIILGTVEFMGRSLVGNSGKFNEVEDYMLSTSVPKLLERMSPEVADKTASFLYPLMIGFASISYAVRVGKIARVQNEAIPNTLQSEPITTSNGQYAPQKDDFNVTPQSWDRGR